MTRRARQAVNSVGLGFLVWCQRLAGWPDFALSKRYALGFNALGTEESSASFRSRPLIPISGPRSARDLSQEQTLGDAEAYGDELERTMGPQPEDRVDGLEWTRDVARGQATAKDIKRGLRGPLVTRGGVDATLGRGRWTPSRRFAIKQREGYRAIDAGRRGGRARASLADRQVHTVSRDFIAAAMAE